MIESKVVEVAENYSQELGLKKGLVFGYDPIGSNGNTPSPVGVPEVTPGDNGGPGFSFSSSNTAEQASGFFGLAIAKYSRLTNLNFQLQLMESESKAKIITSPKVITQNKKKAVINTKETTSYAVQTGVGIDAVTTFEEIEAKLTLEVTPQITNEGSIVLDIKLLKEQFAERPYPAAPPNKLSRDIDTSVLVENGSTIVIGGIYAYENTQNYTGVPWLDKIPIVGWLFRTPYNPKTSKREMIIFLTPRIINQEEAGLESGIKEKG